MFDRLLLSKGGGIIADAQKADQSDRAVIAIGIGGTGIDCLKALKEQVYDRVKPDAGEDSSVPKYRKIKFLAIDTDDIDGIFDESERCKIRHDDLRTILDDREANVANDPSLRWVGTKARMAPRNNVGAGGVRQIGRLCLFKNSDDIISRLKNMITDAQTVALGQNDDPPELYFQIFTGMCGGTGSGCFIDICYIIRGILNETANRSNNKILGYFFLPDFNDDGETYKLINGYAALKELDYCMNYHHNGDEWKQQYRGLAKTVITSDPPVDYAHIISKKNTRNAQTDNPQKVVISAVVDYVLEYMTKTAANVNPSTQDGNTNGNNQQQGQGTKSFDIISHLSNINQYIDNADKNYGSNYNYCIIGASRAYLPYKEINTYAASKVFDSFKYLKNLIPTDDDVKSIMSNGRFNLESIETDIKHGLHNIPTPDPTVQEIEQALNAGQIQDERSFPDCINNVGGGRRLIEAGMGESIREGDIGKMAQNREALKGIIGGLVNQDHEIRSLIDRIRSELKGLLKDPNRGPYYASAVIDGNNCRNIITFFYDYRADVDAKLGNARLTYRGSIDKVNDSISKMRDAFSRRAFARRAKEEAVESYAIAIVDMLKKEREVIALEEVRNVISDLLENKLDALRNEFRRYTNRFNELYETFDENMRHINAMQNAPINDNVIKIVDINDVNIKNYINRQVQNKVGDGHLLVSEYISGMVEREQNAEEKNEMFEEKELVDYSKEFFIKNLSDITNNSLTKYFEIYFGTNNPAELTQNIENVYLDKIGNASIPYMWLSNNSDRSSFKETGFITYPQDALAVASAVNSYQQRNANVFSNANQANIRASYLTDSISLFRFICAVPPFDYNGNILYRPHYAMGTAPGTHLYEHTDEDQTIDFRNLKTIVPLRMLKQNTAYDEDIEKKNNASFIKDLDDYYDKIVRYDSITNECHLEKYDENKLDNYAQEIDALENGTKDFSSSDLDIQNETSLRTDDCQIQIPNRANSDQIDSIVKDIIYSSMVFETKAKQQINNYKKYITLKSRFETIQNSVKSLVEFVNVYSRGLIVRDPSELHKLVLKYEDEYGEKTEELSNARVPFGEDFELYSSYLGFSNLDDNTRETINHFIDTKLRGKIDPDPAILSNELNNANDSINRKLMNIVDMEERKKIEKFYKELKKTNDRL